MTFLPPSASELEQFRSSPEIVKQTVAQIRKDFSMVGEDLDSLASSETYEQLYAEMTSVLRMMLGDDSPQVSALLYRIDISEQKIKKVLHRSEETGLAERLANLILEREIQKVVFRNQYKIHKNAQG